MGNCDEYYKGNSEQLNCSEVNSCPESEQYPNHEPEKYTDEDKFIQESVNNKNLITIKHKHKFSKKSWLNLSDLNYSTASPVYDFLENKYTLLKEHRNKSGIYLIHNNINGKNI
jgi:hypothetical protein